MYAHKNRRDGRCRIEIARLEIRQMLRTDFCRQGCYSSIDVNICLVTTPVYQCRIKVVRGPWHILSAGPLRRGLATFATSTGAR